MYFTVPRSTLCERIEVHYHIRYGKGGIKHVVHSCTLHVLTLTGLPVLFCTTEEGPIGGEMSCLFGTMYHVLHTLKNVHPCQVRAYLPALQVWTCHSVMTTSTRRVHFLCLSFFPYMRCTLSVVRGVGLLL